MDAETVKAFKDIIRRISEDAIDEMAEDEVKLNSVNYMEKMAVKFDRFAELLSDK
jgi:hypothetical protein